MKTLRQIILWLCLPLLATTSLAHKASDAWLQVLPSGNWQYSVALRDLDHALESLDANGDRQLTWGEVQAQQTVIIQLVAQNIGLRCKQSELPLRWAYEALEQRSDGVFLRMIAPAVSNQECTAQDLELRYAMMLGLDADHRAIFSMQSSSRVLQPSEEWARAVPDTSAWGNLISFMQLGIEHIGSGADHIAFVICLVLGIALRSQWRALLITITAFTLGHSITLVSATLGWVGSPVWVEPVIALSIALAAALNLMPQSFSENTSPFMRLLRSSYTKAAVAGVFGLIHGLGFSGAMTAAQIPEGALLWALAGFNLGVEIGQLLIISAWSIIYFALHRWTAYRKWLVPTLSYALIVLSLYWFVDRSS